MEEMKRLLMVTAAGPDRPGITATLTGVLVRHGAEVVDIEQASLQSHLGLYFLLDLSRVEIGEDSVIKDLLFEANKLQLTLNFRLFSEAEVRAVNERNLFVLTHFGGTRGLYALSSILGEERVNIQTISTVTHHGETSMEMVINVNEAPNLSRLKERIMLTSRDLGIDLALQKMEAYRKNKRLVFFDMDSTLVDMEIIDEMARRAGVYNEVSRITEKAMRGEFDFEESLRQRVALLKGLKVEALNEMKSHIPLSDGVEELVATLKWLGYKLGVVTGGFDFFADPLKEQLGFHFCYSNRLEIKDGVLTGAVAGEVIDSAWKARIVNQTACDEKILLDQTVVVGDGANDALMLGQAGLSIAYNAKKGLEQSAGASIGKSRMKNILHFLGITEEDVTEALSCRP
ncbi:MAG: phosphoserine phosphatase SerB [Deltaproteobacteria bacterium]|nr:phosphoserine phosphatase SerB [Deltaproteobacteria bacterium]